MEAGNEWDGAREGMLDDVGETRNGEGLEGSILAGRLDGNGETLEAFGRRD